MLNLGMARAYVTSYRQTHARKCPPRMSETLKENNCYYGVVGGVNARADMHSLVFLWMHSSRLKLELKKLAACKLNSSDV